MADHRAAFAACSVSVAFQGVQAVQLALVPVAILAAQVAVLTVVEASNSARQTDC